MKPFGAFSLLVRGVVWIVSAGLLTLLLASEATSRLDNALYDLNMQYWRYTPSGDVVIVAIDQKSIDALGSWPWARANHGRLIDKLTDLGVRNIGTNILIATPDTNHPENDQILAQAIRRNGRVVMPIYDAPSAPGAPLQVRLPIPEIASAAASLGELVVPIDDDGLSRAAFMYGGIGKPEWPFVPLAVYQLDHPQPEARRRGREQISDPLGESPFVWTRYDYVFVRYAGPAGTFPNLSYVDVLNGNVEPGLLKGKTVLIGMTAWGVGDRFAVPGLRPDAPMPAIEYIANVLESLRPRLLDRNTRLYGKFSVRHGSAGVSVAHLRMAWLAPPLGGSCGKRGGDVVGEPPYSPPCEYLVATGERDPHRCRRIDSLERARTEAETRTKRCAGSFFVKPFGMFSLLVRGVVWIVSAGVLTLMLASDVTSRLDNALYDLNMRYWQYIPSGDVVIVAIDPKSIDALGLWPWPRATHGRLINTLTDLGVSTIGMNVYFVSPDANHPEGDRLLAQAIRRHGRVVMPVYANTSKLAEPLEVKLPIPEVRAALASLGELVVPVSDDGIARIALLHGGIGKEDWPFLSLAIYQLDHPWRHDEAQGEEMLLRYAGPPGTFSTFSYIDVLNGRVDPGLIKGKTVLIGVTATGATDRYLAPGARSDSLMAGVEYVANVLESLRRGLLITRLGFAGSFVFGMVALAFPPLIYGWPGLRRTWVVAAVSIAAALLASLVMLRLATIWWPPVSAILIVVVESIVWGVLRPKLTREPTRSTRIH